MEKKELVSVLIVFALIAITALVLSLMGEALPDSSDSQVAPLPRNVADYEGTDVLYCSNEQCNKAYVDSELTTNNFCPTCSSRLSSMAPVERRLLPTDTKIFRKQYSTPDKPGIVVTKVVSGKERTSIHRPEVCLEGQGYKITGSEVVGVDSGSEMEIRVMILDLQNPAEGRSRSVSRNRYLYAYWFSTRERQTPYHFQRIVWTAYDNVFKGIAPRWAYTTVGTVRASTRDDDLARLRAFVADLYFRTRAD